MSEQCNPGNVVKGVLRKDKRVINTIKMNIEELKKKRIIDMTAEEFCAVLLDIQERNKPAEKDNPSSVESEKPITQPEAIEFLGKSRQTLSTWRKKGLIKGHAIGGRVFFLKSELLAAVKNNGK